MPILSSIPGSVDPPSTDFPSQYRIDAGSKADRSIEPQSKAPSGIGFAPQKCPAKDLKSLEGGDRLPRKSGSSAAPIAPACPPRSTEEIYRTLKAGIKRALANQAPEYCCIFDPSQESCADSAWREFERRDRLLLRQIRRADLRLVEHEGARAAVLVIEFRPDEQWCLILGGQIDA
jgi:hypothetical protein